MKSRRRVNSIVRRQGNMKSRMVDKAFLSYQHEHKQLVLEVRRQLEQFGIVSIVDEWTFQKGRSLPTEISHGIDASNSFVLFWSKASARSRYVKFERELALVRSIKEEDYGIHVVRLDSTPVPRRHAFLLHHDWRRGRVGTKLFRDHVESLALALRGLPQRQARSTRDQRTLLVVVAGPSGVGKDVVLSRLAYRLEKNGYPVAKLTRYTTRSLRPGEKQGDPMASLSKEEFYKQWRKGVIACEHTSFGNSYGVDSSFAGAAPEGSTILHSMRNLVVLDDIKARAVERGISVVNVLLTADEESLRARILQRTASSEEKAARIVTVQDDLAWIEAHAEGVKKTFHLILENSDSCSLRACVDSVYQFITSRMDQSAKRPPKSSGRLTPHAADRALAKARRG